MEADGGTGRARAFIALEIPSDRREAFARLGDSLREVARGACFVRPESIHLTLRFLGDSSSSELGAIARGLEPIAAACPVATARVSGLGVFPPHGAARVLWLGLELPAAVRRLQEGTERVATAAGFPPQRRRFEPHLTLARWREPVPSPTLPPLDLAHVRLERMLLVRSELHPYGATHTVLRAFALGES